MNKDDGNGKKFGSGSGKDTCNLAAHKEGRESADQLQVSLGAIDPSPERLKGARVPTPLKDKDGRVTGAVNLLVDLSDRVARDIDCARLAAIVESSDDVIVSKPRYLLERRRYPYPWLRGLGDPGPVDQDHRSAGAG